MARPAPTTLTKTVLDDGYTDLVITATSGLYVVCYRGTPINAFREAFGPRKYLRTLFPNVGHARLLARKLNDRFKTDEFEVRECLLPQDTNPGRSA